MDDFSAIAEQFFDDYKALKKKYKLLLRVRAESGKATIEIYQEEKPDNFKRIIKLEEENQLEAYRAGIREIARFKALQKYKEEKEKKQ